MKRKLYEHPKSNTMRMSKSIIISLLLAGTAAKSQVAIGKQTVTNASVSLEFDSTENRGFVLPYITDKSSVLAEGSTIYDTTDHKVKYLKDNGVWINLSEDDGTAATIGAVDLSIQQSKTEQVAAKTTIGTNGATDTTNGILVLTDVNKAMILPKVASPHLNIVNPAAGMMVYDTTKKQLAIYNGTVWSFWKP